MTSALQAEHGKENPKEVMIIINGRETPVPKDWLTFEEIVSYAFPNPPTGQDVEFSIQYSKGVEKPSGTLVAGQSVKIKRGMQFDVTPTNRS